jgi:acetyl-CoA synthetase
MNLTPLLEPRSIAVVGATERPDAYGFTILDNLARLGFAGPVWGVNPRREAVLGVPCVPSIDELPEAVDAVAIAIPAAGVPEAVAAVGRRGCGGAVVVSAGFGEVAAGRALEDELRAAAAAASLPVLGPNGNGIVNVPARAGIWGDSVQPLEPGGVCLISQSGNVAVNALGSRRGIGFHTVISTGNGAVCDAAEWLLALSERDGVGSIALFLESDGDGDRLAEGLARCAERGVRVVVLKVGSSEAGAVSASSHTGALAGDQRVFRALVEESGASVASNPHELLELARVLAEPRARPSPAGDRGGLAILTCSGGDSGISADEAERLGVELPPFGVAAAERLSSLIPGAATVANPLDYTSLIWAETERLREIVLAAGDDPAIDQLLVFHDTPQDLSPEAAESWAATRAGLAQGAAGADAAAIFASTLPDLIGEEIIRELAAEGIAAVAGLSTAVLAARELRRTPGDPARLREIAAAAGVRGEPGEWLGEAEAKALLRAAGVPTPEGRLARSAAEAGDVAAELRPPLALKLSGPRIQHKSDIGALALGLCSPEQVGAEADRMLALPEAAGARLLVEEMAPAGAELIVAARADAVVPALIVGLGGIWTEALADVAVVPLPASPARVERALRSLSGAALLTGARGGEAADLAAAAEAASRIGDVLLDQRLALLEVNPLIVSPTGAVAADAVARQGA